MAFGISSASAGSWRAEGRIGSELESTHEEFGSGSLSDARLDLSTDVGASPDPEESILARRFTDRTTRWSALADFGLEREGDRLFRSRAVLRLGRLRSRGDLEVQTDGPTRFGRLGASGRFVFQGGPEGGDAGQSLMLRSTWTPPWRLWGVETRGIVAGERSWAGHDSLSALFNYRRLLPSVELRRALGHRGDLSVRGGLGRKYATGADAGDYRERWLEGEWNWADWTGPQANLRLRSGSRTYPSAAGDLPSYDELSIDAETEFDLWRHWRVRLAPSLERAAYASDDSLVFRDHWNGELLLRVEHALGRAADSLAVSPTEISLYAGIRQVVLRNERVREADYDATSFVLGGGRTPTARWWLDASGEVGRRDYRQSGLGGTLVYEGYNLTVTGTDFTFVSCSLIAQVSLGRAFRLDWFGLYDRELHRDSVDDFSLWSLTGAATWSF